MKRLIVTAAAALLASCASYSDTTKAQQLSSDTHRLSMSGTAFNDQSDAHDFAMMKAAEVTLDSGARYFSVLDAQDKTKVGTYVAPSTSTSSTFGTATAYGNTNYYGSSANTTVNTFGQSTTTTTYNPGQSYNFVKPGAEVVIRTYNVAPSFPHFDAEEIVKYLGPVVNPDRWGEVK